ISPSPLWGGNEGGGYTPTARPCCPTAQPTHCGRSASSPFFCKNPIGKGERFGYQTFAASFFEPREALHASIHVRFPHRHRPTLGPCHPRPAVKARRPRFSLRSLCKTVRPTGSSSLPVRF